MNVEGNTSGKILPGLVLEAGIFAVFCAAGFGLACLPFGFVWKAVCQIVLVLLFGVWIFLTIRYNLRNELELLACVKEIREENTLFHTAIENSPFAIFVSSDRGYSYVNKECLKLFGVKDQEEVIGHPVLEFFTQEYHAEITARKKALRKMMANPLVEQDILRKDKTIRTVEIYAIPILYRGEHCSLVFAHDVTQRKIQEKEGRAMELRLFQTQRLESLGKLASGVAHDFNNMLQIIQGNAELLLMGESPDSDRAAMLHEISDTAKNSTALTRRLLAFARKQPVAAQLIDFNANIEADVTLVKRMAGKQITVKEDFGIHLPRVSIDPIQLNQIVMNILINADEAMEGKGTIEISTSRMDEEQKLFFPMGELNSGSFNVLRIKDSGCGMPPEVLEKIWDPFFSTKPKGKGSGLGLSTVYGIARQNGGYVYAASQPGNGSTFYVFLPWAEDKIGEEAGTIKPEILMSRIVAHFGEYALVVDDEPSLCSYVMRVLEREGYTVFSAASAEEAIKISQAHTGSIHFLITDMMMPGMNGKDLHNILSKERPEMKTIIMSGFPSGVLDGTDKARRSFLFLQKPFSIAELEAALEEAKRL